MTKKKIVSIVLSWLFILLFIGGMGVLVHLTRNLRHGISCNEIDITIKGEHRFMEEERLKSIIDGAYGLYVGERVEDVDLGKIEKMLAVRPEVSNCEVWITDDGVLHVDVLFRTPLLRIDNGEGKGYYVDRECNIFPLSDSYQADVPAVRCPLKTGLDNEWLTNAIDLAWKIAIDPKWSARITGYEVASNMDLVLISDGTEIIFGDFADQARKFNAMEKYYGVIAPLHKDDPYKKVNIKYNGQIICRKG